MFSLRFGGALVVLLVGLTTLTLANENKKEKNKGQNNANNQGATIKANQVNSTNASTVNFGKDLRLGFGSLDTLGSRIQQARKAADPVALANLANELNVAEKVSGKKAAVTSESLMKEAVELAELRRKPDELKAVSELASDRAIQDKLAKDVKAAEKNQQDLAARQNSGEQPRGLFGTLRIENYTNDPMDVYVNGELVGNVGGRSPGYGFSYYEYPITAGLVGTTVVGLIDQYTGEEWDAQIPEATTFKTITVGK